MNLENESYNNKNFDTKIEDYNAKVGVQCHLGEKYLK